jgi:predicted amidophosphoribosyltransferase
MARRKLAATFPSCARCGATARSSSAQFCRTCGDKLSRRVGNLTDWQRHAPAKGKVVSMKQHVLSCPECGEPMRYAFRKVCRQCGANLVMMPQRFHWNHMRVFVQGPRATLYTFTSLVIYLAFAFAVLIAVRVVMNALK